MHPSLLLQGVPLQGGIGRSIETGAMIYFGAAAVACVALLVLGWAWQKLRARRGR